MPNLRHYLYRGEHRKPGTSKLKSTIIVSAAVTAASLGLGGTGYAAEGGTWDKLAQCESGGRWDINTGNGFSGGLQFTPQTWRAFGGSGAAHNASRAEQIRVAERVLAGQGWGAWPACSAKLGLRGKAAPRAEKPAAPKKQVAPPKAKKAAKKAAPKQAAPQRVAKKKVTAPPKGSYVVQRGDTLVEIAAANGTTWRILWEKNPQIKNPNMIYVGSRISV